jgi:single-stranded DNA-specific DHH superfamily exonuclease
MSLGIECLLADDEARAANCAQELDRLNRERRQIESGMLEGATVALDALAEPPGAAVALFDAGWHQGVVGILASRVREKVHRPTICFARAANGELRGSGRSIPGLHLRDCLDLVAKREPGLLLRFGGHAQAAGLTIRESELERFTKSFEQTAATLLPEAHRLRIVETDGALEPGYHSIEVAQMLESHIWGQGLSAAALLRHVCARVAACCRREASETAAAEGRQAIRGDALRRTRAAACEAARRLPDLGQRIQRAEERAGRRRARRSLGCFLEAGIALQSAASDSAGISP